MRVYGLPLKVYGCASCATCYAVAIAFGVEVPSEGVPCVWSARA
jgi:hypothetical protein